jgi:glycosidase
MKFDDQQERFWLEITNLDAQTEYAFQYLVDGEIRVSDPYSEKILDPWNDKYISEASYPNLKPYPEGKTDGLVSVFQIEESEYEWQNNSFEAPAVSELVVYELLVRDFVAARNYQTLIDTLGYLKKLGVNAIELMPVNEFDGNLSWGYNPNHYLALDKFYGTPNAFKEFVDVCHGEGIAIILDVVFNHATGISPYVKMYYNNDLNRPADDSPFYNEIPTHDFNVFSDMNHEYEGSREYIKRAISYWLEEYKVDGYRLDLSKGFTQKNTLGNVGAWGQYDQSRVDIINEYAAVAWSANPDAYFILEHFADNSEEKVLANNGMMLWGNLNHNYNESSMGYIPQSDFSWISYQKRGWDAPHVMGYMESHDEERLMYKNITYGKIEGDYSTRDTTTAFKRMALAANFFFTIPGPKMMWMFGETGYDYPIEYNGRTGEKPIRWDYLENWKRRQLNYTYSSLIQLKKEYDVFNTTDFDLDVGGAMKKIKLASDEMSVVVLGNFDVTDGSIVPEFYSTGTWYEYWTGDSIIVTDVNAPIELMAGEYRLYTDKKLDTPDFVGIDETPQLDNKVSDLILYPNPTHGQMALSMHIKQAANVSVKVYDLQGRMVQDVFNGKLPAGIRNISFDLDRAKKGFYFVTIEIDGGQLLTKKLIIN